MWVLNEPNSEMLAYRPTIDMDSIWLRLMVLEFHEVKDMTLRSHADGKYLPGWGGFCLQPLLYACFIISYLPCYVCGNYCRFLCCFGSFKKRITTVSFSGRCHPALSFRRYSPPSLFILFSLHLRSTTFSRIHFRLFHTSPRDALCRSSLPLSSLDHHHHFTRHKSPTLLQTRHDW